MTALLLDTGGLAGAAPSQTQNDEEQLPEQRVWCHREVFFLLPTGAAGALGAAATASAAETLRKQIPLLTSSEVRGASPGVSRAGGWGLLQTTLHDCRWQTSIGRDAQLLQ